ncbi:MAG: preprotein translocase subunit SecG [Gemmatimonadota bacterium]
MYPLLLTLLLLDGLLLTVVVLLQSGKGGGLASMGGGMGTDTLIGGRQAATILTKATWITGALFLVLSLVLAILSSRSQQPSSILREEFRPAPAAAPAPVQLPGTQPAAPATTPGAQPQAPATTTN